jgi:hypothetical protein
VSCSATGDCTAAGTYVSSSSWIQPFVVTETNGTWGQATALPGVAKADPTAATTNLSPDALSCGAAGNCALLWDAGYPDNNSFISVQKDGSWGQPQKVAGVPAGASTFLDAVACASTGNCVVTGEYGSAKGKPAAFVVADRSGHWGSAQAIPGLAALGASATPDPTTVSCPSAGNCTIAGTYTQGHGTLAFAVSEHGGTWSKAVAVPGLKKLLGGLSVEQVRLSCSAAGSCLAGSYYPLRSGHQHEATWIASEKNGKWGNAEHVPGIATISKGGDSGVESLSCGAPGYCAVVGYYTPTAPAQFTQRQGFVATEVGGAWHKAEAVPGLKALSGGRHSELTSVSCRQRAACSAIGTYNTASSATQMLVTGRP